MNFGQPELVLFVPALAGLLSIFLWWAWRRRQKLVSQFVRSRLLEELTAGVSRALQKLRLALVAAAAVLALAALTRPQWGFTWEQSKQRGLDILVAIDVSRSMLAEDVPPSRMARTRLAALDLLRQTRSDRVGLIAFAGSAFLQCPLTLDDEAFRQSLEAINVGVIPAGGSAIAQAIETALQSFEASADNHQALIILTDGEDHDRAETIAAVDKAAKAGLRIFTVGVGTGQGAQLRERSAKGTPSVIRDNEGNVVVSRLNEELLQEIAARTKAFYLPLRGAQTMEVLYQRGLAPLPKGEVTARAIKRFHERFQWPLAIAIIVLVMEMILPDRKRAPRASGAPRPAPGIPRAVPAATAAVPAARLALLLLLLPGLGLPSALASPRTAWREYQKGNYPGAWEEYQRLQKSRPDDPRLNFNAGASAYQAGKLEEARDQFQAALSAEDVNLQQRSLYNLGNTWYRLGENEKPLERKTQAWEQALKQFQNAITLNTNDVDAQFNHDFVKQKLEELKQQQQQQQQKQQPQQAPKDQQNQPDEPKDREKSDAPAPKDPDQQHQQSPDPQKDNGESQSPPKSPDSPPDAPPNEGQNPNEKRDPGSPAPGQTPEPNDQPGKDAAESAAQAAREGRMTEEQARQMLEGQRVNERALLFLPPDKARAKGRSVKDW